MRRHGLSLIMWLGVLSLGCGDDAGASDGDSGSSGSSGGSGSASMTTAGMTTAGMTTTAGMSADGSTTMPPDDTGTGSTTMPPADSSGTMGEPTTSGPADSSGSGSSSGGGGGSEYPACEMAKPPCPKPYDGCYTAVKGFSVCTQTCASADDCPAAGSGDATVVCAGPQMDQCLLDCSNDEMCPDDMECQPIGFMNIQRCVWANN